jgi:hypothetical protein
VQVIKVHTDRAGKPQEDEPSPVKGIPPSGGCATWSDDDFDATAHAVYYVRVLQVPTFRWSHWDCTAIKSTDPILYNDVCPGKLDTSIEERAWTSPIWYEPR